MTTERRRRLLPIATVIVALATAALVALVVGGTTSSCSAFDGGETVCTSTSESLIEREGTGVLVVLLVPAAIGLVGVARPTERVLGAVAAAIGLCCVLGILTIGLFYVPTLVAAAVAAAGTRRTCSSGPTGAAASP